MADNLIVPAIAFQQRINCLKIVRQAAPNVMLFQPITHGHLHGTGKTKFARLHVFQPIDRRAQHEVTLKYSPAETSPSHLDLLGQSDLLLAREQRKTTDLLKILDN